VIPTALFTPNSIAIAGASSNPDSPGHDYVRAIKDFGFAGPIYPINPRAPEILGVTAYPALADVPADVDAVISCIPSDGVLDLIAQAKQKRVQAIIMFTGRFSETGDADAAALEQRVLDAARQAGIRLLGPNCMGVYDSAGRLSFRPDLPHEPGNVAFISQSGNNSVELMLHGAARGLRFSTVVSYGNALDLTEADLLEHFARDKRTAVVGAYIEGARDGRRLFDALKTCAAAKPVVILKGGRTSSGSRTAASHTAALAGQRQIWSAVFRQAGAVEATTFDDLLDLLAAFALLQPPRSRIDGRPRVDRPRVGIVGGGGGRAVQSADVAEEAGLAVPRLPDEIRATLRDKAPGLADWVDNPVDQSILAGSGVSGARILEMMIDHPSFDALIANVGEDWVLGRPDAVDRMAHLVDRFVEIGQKSQKPLAFILGEADSLHEDKWRAVAAGKQRFVDAQLPVYSTVDRAARALARFLEHHFT
jgi:acyl-CoA synthetase (NDP forming)